MQLKGELEKGGAKMATSSITANFEITDPKAARAFVDGLWKAYRMKPPRRPKNVQFVSVTDPDEIRALMSKWKSRKKVRA